MYGYSTVILSICALPDIITPALSFSIKYLDYNRNPGVAQSIQHFSSWIMHLALGQFVVQQIWWGQRDSNSQPIG